MRLEVVEVAVEVVVQVAARVLLRRVMHLGVVVRLREEFRVNIHCRKRKTKW